MDYTASLMSQGVKINPACIHRARTLLFPLSSPHERLRSCARIPRVALRMKEKHYPVFPLSLFAILDVIRS